LTDAQFLSNNSVICEANHVKFEPMHDSWAYKIPWKFSKSVKGVAPQLFTKKWKFLIFLGRIPTACGNLGEILHIQADPRALPSLTWISATSRPCGTKNLIFGLAVSKFDTGSLPRK